MKRRAGGSAFFWKVMNLDFMDSEISNVGGTWCVTAAGHCTEAAHSATGKKPVRTPESGATGVQEAVSTALAASSPCRTYWHRHRHCGAKAYFPFSGWKGQFRWFTTRARPGAVEFYPDQRRDCRTLATNPVETFLVHRTTQFTRQGRLRAITKVEG